MATTPTITERHDPALRISNAVTSGSFGDHLFSPTLASRPPRPGRRSTFTASFVLEPVTLQPGLRVTVSPDNGQGGRGGFLAIEHTNGGINLVSQGSFVDRRTSSSGRSRRWPPGSTPASRTP